MGLLCGVLYISLLVLGRIGVSSFTAFQGGGLWVTQGFCCLLFHFVTLPFIGPCPSTQGGRWVELVSLHCLLSLKLGGMEAV